MVRIHAFSSLVQLVLILSALYLPFINTTIITAMPAEQMYNGNYAFVARNSQGVERTYVGLFIQPPTESKNGPMYLLKFGDNQTRLISQSQCWETNAPVSRRAPRIGARYPSPEPEPIPPLPTSS